MANHKRKKRRTHVARKKPQPKNVSFKLGARAGVVLAGLRISTDLTPTKKGMILKEAL